LNKLKADNAEKLKNDSILHTIKQMRKKKRICHLVTLAEKAYNAHKEKKTATNKAEDLTSIESMVNALSWGTRLYEFAKGGSINSKTIIVLVLFAGIEVTMLAQACVVAQVSPRCAKQLVNVYKVLKLIWNRQDEISMMGRRVRRDQRVRDAGVWMLAMSASTSQPLRSFMREVFLWIEQNRSTNELSLYALLNSLPSHSSDDKKHFDKDIIYARCMQSFREILARVSWPEEGPEEGPEAGPEEGQWTKVRSHLHLIRCLSFVGEPADKSVEIQEADETSRFVAALMAANQRRLAAASDEED
jgi:hypothetical protein